METSNLMIGVFGAFFCLAAFYGIFKIQFYQKLWQEKSKKTGTILVFIALSFQFLSNLIQLSASTYGRLILSDLAQLSLFYAFQLYCFRWCKNLRCFLPNRIYFKFLILFLFFGLGCWIFFMFLFEIVVVMIAEITLQPAISLLLGISTSIISFGFWIIVIIAPKNESKELNRSKFRSILFLSGLIGIIGSAASYVILITIPLAQGIENELLQSNLEQWETFGVDMFTFYARFALMTLVMPLPAIGSPLHMKTPPPSPMVDVCMTPPPFRLSDFLMNPPLKHQPLARERSDGDLEDSIEMTALSESSIGLSK